MEYHTLSNLNMEELELFKSLFNFSEVRPSSSSWNNQVIHSHYCRVYEFRYWNIEEVDKLQQKVDQFNSKCKSAIMKITDYTDWEMEYDGDRSYPASFTFSIIPK